jgi:predicted CopG family antitoxin
MHTCMKNVPVKTGSGHKATAMIRIAPAVRAALGKKRVDRESYSSVIARLLAREQGLTDVGLQRI